MNFYEGILRVVEGKKITREEWENKAFYVYMRDDILYINKDDEEIHPWTIHKDDVLAVDWRVLA